MLTRLFQVEAASPPRQSGGETVLLAWRLTAWVAGVFSLLVGITLLVEHTRAKPNDLLQPPQLIAAKEQLRLDPTNPQLKQDIRELDWRLRQRIFPSFGADGIWRASAGGRSHRAGAGHDAGRPLPETGSTARAQSRDSPPGRALRGPRTMGGGGMRYRCGKWPFCSKPRPWPEPPHASGRVG